MSTDTRTDACPTWCVEHYRADDGTCNHSSHPRVVTGDAAADDSAVSVSVWAEVRELDGVRRAVGVLEKRPAGDVELCPCTLRTLAGHLLAVAELVEAVGGMS